jgi:hypothetical protein|tara:strand:- start:959 stop:1579 length:621 start_codon:yes stop_codon:yes gene_type:complete
VRLNLDRIVETLRNIREYLFPVKKLTSKFSTITTLEQLKVFIQEKSAHVTQTTLYGYVKTRMGFKYTLMFENKEFLHSLEIAKWNIYVAALSDCTLYTFSYLMSKKNLKDNISEQIFCKILEEEKSNGLSEKLIEESHHDFKQRLREVNWNSYYLEGPFLRSGLALYKWSPISDELKKDDKEIVLNSIKYKWNLVESEFKELTENF